MGIGVGFYIRNLVEKDIRQRIATAWLRGKTLSVSEQSIEIARSHPGSGTDDDLRNQLFADATGVGVPVKLAKAPEKPD